MEAVHYQAAGHVLMLTAPLTKAALLKLTGFSSIMKFRMQPMKELRVVRLDVSRDSGISRFKKKKKILELMMTQIVGLVAESFQFAANCSSAESSVGLLECLDYCQCPRGHENGYGELPILM